MPSGQPLRKMGGNMSFWPTNQSGQSVPERWQRFSRSIRCTLGSEAIWKNTSQLQLPASGSFMVAASQTKTAWNLSRWRMWMAFWWVVPPWNPPSSTSLTVQRVNDYVNHNTFARLNVFMAMDGELSTSSNSFVIAMPNYVTCFPPSLVSY